MDDAINAFCWAGGRIGIYTGIIRKLDLNDDELAAVIGHEISHALREHQRETASQQALSSAIVQGIANSSQRNAPAAAAMAELGSLLLFRLPFSREMEIEADAMGIELIARAGFDPRAAANIWRKMALRSPAGSSDFLHTHPSNERRIAEAEAIAGRLTHLSKGRQRIEAVQTLTVESKSPVDVRDPNLQPSAVANSIAYAKASESSFSGLSAKAKALAITQSCHVDPKVTMVVAGQGYESFSVPCANGDTIMIRCEANECRVLR